MDIPPPFFFLNSVCFRFCRQHRNDPNYALSNIQKAWTNPRCFQNENNDIADTDNKTFTTKPYTLCLNSGQRRLHVQHTNVQIFQRMGPLPRVCLFTLT